MDAPVYITKFETANEAIAFAMKYWDENLNAIQAIRGEDKELDELNENKEWLCIVGVCDICKVEGVYFMPACVYEDGIEAVECSACENMSLYPKEADDGEESQES